MGRRVKADHLRVIRRIYKEMPADAKHLAQQRFVHDLGRGANGSQGAVFQHADTVAKGGLVQVMQRDDGGGWQALARAICTRCCSPPDSVCQCRSPKPDRSTSAKACVTMASS